MNAGRITLGACGRWCEGAVEAERSCMLAMLQAIRSQYNLFPADFNYVAISEKRGLFNAMKNAFDPCHAEFVEMSNILKERHSELSMLCDFASVWIGDHHHPFVEMEDIRVASEFQACMSVEAAKLYNDLFAKLRPHGSSFRSDCPPQCGSKVSRSARCISPNAHGNC